jgi:hypothetical protein
VEVKDEDTKQIISLFDFNGHFHYYRKLLLVHSENKFAPMSLFYGNMEVMRMYSSTHYKPSYLMTVPVAVAERFEA